MILFRNGHQLAGYLEQEKKKGKMIGFVPTMGALHHGHLSLVESAKQHTDITVCSIFVNPTQFNDPTDFQKYPITIEYDIFLLEKAQTDVLFLPQEADLYPNGVAQLESYDLGYLETILEGKSRPGHFQGVCQVMERLLTLVRPDDLFMGQKDYQQCMVVKKLLTIMKMPVRFHACPIQREADGLAMSSRNMRLNETQRKNASAIFTALYFIKSHIGTMPLNQIKAQAWNILLENSFRIDYIEIVDAITLEEHQEIKDKHDLVALIAAYQAEVRLIDNMLL